MKKLSLKIFALSVLIAAKINAQSPGDIVITEFMPDPSKVSDASGEWFELYNTSDHAVDLNGWHISDLKTKNHVLNAAGPLLIKSNGFLLFAIKSDSTINGGIVPDYTYSSFTFINSAGKFALTDTAGVIIDSITYSSTTAGKSWSLDPMHFKAPDNDIPANWCTGNITYGMGDMGTPKKMNTSCISTEIPTVIIKPAISLHVMNGELSILFPELVEKQKWEIINITGRVVQSGSIQELTANLSILLNRNERGMYFFRLNKSGTSLKFVVE